MITKTITIINKLGLHARAAAKLVATASRFSSHIELKKQSRDVNAKSIMGVMMLAATQGTALEISAEGEDEADAMLAIENLIQDKFGESE